MPSTEPVIDHHEVLGVARGASAAEVKRAFRTKARRLHPDRSDHPGAADAFQRLVESYEALVGTGEAVAPPVRRAPPVRIREPRAAVELSAIEATRGAVRTVTFAFQRPCERCRGEGIEPGAAATRCGSCGGRAHSRAVSSSDEARWIRVEACDACGGTGVGAGRCRDCRGTGRIAGVRDVEVAIPERVEDGATIRVGGGGNVNVTGEVGEGLVDVSVRPLPDSRWIRLLAVSGVVAALGLLLLVLLT